MGQVRWTEEASRNLEDIFNYVAKNSAVYADRLVKTIISSTSKLVRMPRCGRMVPELKNHDIRELIYQNYRIVYRITEETGEIEILAVIHGARDFFNAYHSST